MAARTLDVSSSAVMLRAPMVFGLEGCVEAGRINAHGRGQIADLGGLEPLFPEDLQRLLKRLVAVEFSGSSTRGHGSAFL
jgi:hypothetical protein